MPNVLDTLIYGYREMQQAGVTKVARGKLNFISGFTLTDNPMTGATDVSPSSSAVTLAGDVTGPSGVTVVGRVNGVTYPIGGALVTGNVPQVSGSSAVVYGPVNLAGGANYVTGLLPTGNQASQALAGGVTGTTAASVVEQLNGSAGVATVTCDEVQGGTTDGWRSIRAVATTTAVTANQTLLSIPVAADTSYDVNVRVLARDTTASGGFRGTITADLFTRRTGTNSGNLERQGSKPTNSEVKAYGTQAAATFDTEVSSNAILIRATPGSANSTDWVVLVDLVRNN